MGRCMDGAWRGAWGLVVVMLVWWCVLGVGKNACVYARPSLPVIPDPSLTPPNQGPIQLHDTAAPCCVFLIVLIMITGLKPFLLIFLMWESLRYLLLDKKLSKLLILALRREGGQFWAKFALRNL